MIFIFVQLHILLQLESTRSRHAKFLIVVPASKQQEITNKITLLLLVHTAYIQVLVSPHILFVLNHAFYAMPTSVSNVGQI